MADRIAVLDGGRIVQVGTPHDIYDRPTTTFVAQLVGTPRINLLDAQRSNGTLTVGGFNLPTPTNSTLPERVTVGIRPEDVKPGSGDYRGEVALIEPLGVETILHLRAGSSTLLSVVPGTSRFSLGEVVPFSLSRERLHYFDKNGLRL
jgi:multiple sugar transport system ATP-binding protein